MTTLPKNKSNVSHIIIDIKLDKNNKKALIGDLLSATKLIMICHKIIINLFIQFVTHIHCVT